jgi:hypothetical protein
MMKKYIQLALFTSALFMGGAQAGNPSRSGGAGGTQMLLNPFGRSAGMMGANTASLRGVESMHFNVGGLAYVESTELMLNRVVYLQGTDVFMNNLSFAQNLGSGNVIGISFTNMQLGDILIRTESQPDGNLGTFTPQILNIGFAYAKQFSNSITAGAVVRLVSEGIADVSTTGVGFDFGVQYQTALNSKNKIKKEDFRFGIGVRNIGPDMNYAGSGLSFRAINPQTSADRRAYLGAEKFNLPALVHIGVGYDIRLDKNPDTYFHRLTPSGNFNYNAFSANMISVGGEYAFKETFMIRGGYGYQEDIVNDNFRTMYYGYSGGLSVNLPVSDNGTKLGIDYSYAPTRVFNGVHNISLRLTLGSKKS